MDVRQTKFSSLSELEETRSKLNQIIKKYDNGDKELNEKYSSSDFQKIENELRENEHLIWKLEEYKKNGIGSRYINSDLSDFKSEKTKESNLRVEMINNKTLFTAKKEEDVKSSFINPFDFLIKYVQDGKCIKTGLSLTFSGSTGTGKTHFSIATMLSLVDRFSIKSSYRFIQMSDLVSLILDKSYKSADKFNNIRDVDILIIDDMSAEKTWANTLEEIMQRVFRHRYNNNLSTISTTNLNLFDFVSHYGERHKSIFCSDTHRSLYFTNENDVRIKNES